MVWIRKKYPTPPYVSLTTQDKNYRYFVHLCEKDPHIHWKCWIQINVCQKRFSYKYVSQTITESKLYQNYYQICMRSVFHRQSAKYCFPLIKHAILSSISFAIAHWLVFPVLLNRSVKFLFITVFCRAFSKLLIKSTNDLKEHSILT